MKVYVLPADNWGCGSYRLTWPAQAAAEVAGADVEVTILPHGSRNLGGTFDPVTAKVNDINRYPQDADLFVIQRPTSYFQPQVIDLMRAKGMAVIVDMDDDLAHIDGRNPAFKGLAPKRPHPQTGQLVDNLHSYHNATEACRRATLVTVTTDRLTQVYGAHGRVRVLPNYVPASYLDVPHEDSPLIGWGGSMHSHPDDLRQVGPAVAKLVQQGAMFQTVGNPAGVGRALGLPADPVSPGDVELLQWAPLIARFGIGIAPLAPTVFNEAKSRLKPLEYAAVGVPSVVSPSADYVKLAAEADGAVQVARKPREWEGMLRALVKDGARRRELSEAARAVAARNTIEANAWRWVEAWHDAVRLQAATKVAAGAA